jgi:hypothetical protein
MHNIVGSIRVELKVLRADPPEEAIGRVFDKVRRPLECRTFFPKAA